jgi:acylphosphatase
VAVIVSRHYRVIGRVQGVGFRFYTERCALREGVHGWVRNAWDGSVEAEAEGDAEAIGRFEAALRAGPPGSRVEDLEITERDPHLRAIGFMVRG